MAERKKRKKYTEKFRAEAVELVVTSGRSIVDCAADMGINEGTLGNWVRLWREEHPEHEDGDPGPVEWAAYQALLVENAELRRQNEFLGKVSLDSNRQGNTTSFGVEDG